MKCKGVYQYICENLDADMNSAKCREIKRHLDSCPNCAAYLDSLKKTILLYKKESGHGIPLMTQKRLHKVIDLAILEFSTGKLRGKTATRINR